MKRILVALVIIVLAVIVFIQYNKLRSLSPPQDYEYTIREDIDLDYHNPLVLGDYYETAHEVGSFAREVWASRSIDVLHPKGDEAGDRVAVDHYNRLKAHADSLGARLSRSLQLKQKGFNNAEIQRIELEGLPLSYFQVERSFGRDRFQVGDKDRGVWLIQEKLIQKGYVMPHDGYFWAETEVAVKAFQKSKGLFASGVADRETLNLLIQE